MSLKRLMISPVRAAAMAALSPLERSLCARATNGAPPVFIVGPPRSGTTLLYELLVTRYRFAYFSNLAHRLYKTPAAASSLGAGAITRWHGRYESRYGHVSGWGAPNEGGWIWQRWIPEEHTLSDEEVARRDLDGLVRTIHAVASVLDAPFINKNVMLGVQMRLLDRLFPGCRFISIQREIIANARSMLRARQEDGGDQGELEWISVRPDGWEAFAHDDAAIQVAAQIRLVNRQIVADGSFIGSQRLACVSYEELCRDTRGTIDRLGAFLGTDGSRLEARGEVPECFEVRTPPEDALTARVRAGLAEFDSRMPEAAGHEAGRAVRVG